VATVLRGPAMNVALVQAPRPRYATISVARLDINVVLTGHAPRVVRPARKSAEINVAQTKKPVVVTGIVAKKDINVVRIRHAKRIAVPTDASTVLKIAVKWPFERRIGFCEMAAHGIRIFQIAITTATVHLAMSALFILATTEMFPSEALYCVHNALD